MVLVSVPASSIFIIKTHGLSDQQYGQVFLPQLLFAVAGALLAGPAVKRVSPKAMWAIALLCLCCSQLALRYSVNVSGEHSLIAIMFSTGFFGFGFGFGGGPLNGLVARHFSNKPDAAITALHLMAGVGLMIGPIYFRTLESMGSWSFGPSSLAVMSIVLFIMTVVSVIAEREQHNVARSASPAVSGYFWLMVFIAFLYALVEGAFSNWAVIFVTGEKAQSADQGSRALAAFWGGLTAGRLIATITVERVGAKRMWMILPLLMTASFVTIPQFSGGAALVIGYAFAGVACSAFFPLMVAVAARPFPEHVSWIASMLTASLMIGVGVGSYVIGAQMQSMPISKLYIYFAVLPVVTFLLMTASSRFAERES